MHGGRARWRWNSPDSMTEAHPASSDVVCGLSTDICYFHTLVISKLPKVMAGSGELSVTALGFSSIEVFVLVHWTSVVGCVFLLKMCSLSSAFANALCGESGKK